MVSDQQIASCVESLLSSSGNSPDSSFAAVLRAAEAELGVDLSHKASFIRDQIDLLLGPRLPSLNPAPPPPPPPLQQQQQLAATNPPVQQQVQPVQMVQQQQQQPVQVTLPHPPPPAHLLFQPIPGLHLINVGGGGNVAGGSASAVGQVPVGAAGVGVGGEGGFLGQVPVAFYPPPPLAYRFGTYQAVPGQQAVMVAPQPVVQVSGSNSTDASKESGTGTAKRKRGGPGGLNKICGVSPELQKIVGETAMSRTQIVKMLWAYIRENNLQDPDDKRKIICNDQLRILFDTDSTDMFKMNKLLSKHIIPLDSFELEARKRRAAEILAAKGDNSEPSDHQISSSELNMVLVSDELAMFIGTEDKEMTRDDALKHVLDYAKANNLEDNENATIVCDTKLKLLLGCDSVPTSGVRDMLIRHFIAES